MKLPIKKKWFDLMKSGKKDVEFRDAHITFVCEETGEELKMQILAVGLPFRNITKSAGGFTEKDMKILFEDDYQISFRLRKAIEAKVFLTSVNNENDQQVLDAIDDLAKRMDSEEGKA